MGGTWVDLKSGSERGCLPALRFAGFSGSAGLSTQGPDEICQGPSESGQNLQDFGRFCQNPSNSVRICQNPLCWSYRHKVLSRSARFRQSSARICKNLIDSVRVRNNMSKSVLLDNISWVFSFPAYRIRNMFGRRIRVRIKSEYNEHNE